ncbi:hypothetical protein ACOMHN_048089 [Nucella lapillus]
MMKKSGGISSRILQFSCSLTLLLLFLLLLPLQQTDAHRVNRNRARNRPAAQKRRRPVLAPQTTENDVVTLDQLDDAIRDCKRGVQAMLNNRRNGDYADVVQLRNKYYLAFRGTAGIGKSVYEAYTSEGHDDHRWRRGLIHCGCLSVNDRRSCNSHYKSRIIPLWSLMKIDKVRVSIYTQGRERVHFEFQGENTTPLNFFSPDKLIGSSFTDTNRLQFTYNYFSIEGHVRMPNVQRRFFVNREYNNGCQKDEGWMVALDSGDDCDFTKRYPLPAFLFSTAATSQLWNSAFIGSGDALVVAVKFKNGFNPNFLQISDQCMVQ